MNLSRFASVVIASVSLLAACSDEPAPSRASSSSSGSSGSVAAGSFKENVAPIFATNCALAACHGSKESNLNFYVTYESAQIYEELMKTSPTCSSQKFVVPGNPEESLVMLKMDGEQETIPAECASARKSSMPPDELIAKEERDVVRAWIKAGAKND